MCCQMHFDKQLLKKGVRLDISLEGERIDRPYGIDYYLWLPTRDKTAPSIEKLRMGVHAMNVAIGAKEKVYAHCKNGHGRGPTMVAAYLIKHKNMSTKEAIAFLKKKRPEIHPETTQRKQLEKWKKICRSGV